MLNKLWPWMIIVSIVFGLLSGNFSNINNTIFPTLENTTSLIINLTAVMCFWCGIIKILTKTSIMRILEKMLRPIVGKIFKNEESDVKDLITINMLSNMIGIGNAATPAGISAMEKMDEKANSEKMTKSMNLFVLMNCLSIQILPTTIMSILSSHGVEDVGKIIIPIWIISCIAFVVIMGVGVCLFQD